MPGIAVAEIIKVFIAVGEHWDDPLFPAIYGVILELHGYAAGEIYVHLYALDLLPLELQSVILDYQKLNIFVRDVLYADNIIDVLGVSVIFVKVPIVIKTIGNVLTVQKDCEAPRIRMYAMAPA